MSFAELSQIEHMYENDHTQEFELVPHVQLTALHVVKSEIKSTRQLLPYMCYNILVFHVGHGILTAVLNDNHVVSTTEEDDLFEIQVVKKLKDSWGGVQDKAAKLNAEWNKKQDSQKESRQEKLVEKELKLGAERREKKSLVEKFIENRIKELGAEGKKLFTYFVQAGGIHLEYNDGNIIPVPFYLRSEKLPFDYYWTPEQKEQFLKQSEINKKHAEDSDKLVNVTIESSTTLDENAGYMENFTLDLDVSGLVMK